MYIISHISGVLKYGLYLLIVTLLLAAGALAVGKGLLHFMNHIHYGHSHVHVYMNSCTLQSLICTMYVPSCWPNAFGFQSTVYIVGTVLLEALVVVIVHIIYAIISGFLRRRVTPPPVPAHIHLQPTMLGFLVFVGRTVTAAALVMRDNVRSWFQSPRMARVRRVPPRTTPGEEK